MLPININSISVEIVYIVSCHSAELSKRKNIKDVKELGKISFL
jgi:hypothetical protein